MPSLTSSVLGSLIVLGVTACGSSDSPKGANHGDAAVGAGGAMSSGGAAGAPAAGGSNDTGGSGGATSECHSSNLSGAPLPCLQDWPHAIKKYPSECVVDPGGYQASCAPYQTILYHSAGTYTWCHYDTGTGNLIAARTSMDAMGAGGTCLFFDVGFTEPDLATCTPVSSNGCEGGAP